MVHFPPQRNLHRDGILAVTEVYAGNIPAGQAARAVRLATAGAYRIEATAYSASDLGAYTLTVN